MTPFPGLHSVLLLDNARIHHSKEVTALVHSYGCIIEYLPPYSPDFQPIKLAFSVIMSHL
jgi:transposase